MQIHSVVTFSLKAVYIFFEDTEAALRVNARRNTNKQGLRGF